GNFSILNYQPGFPHIIIPPGTPFPFYLVSSFYQVLPSSYLVLPFHASSYVFVLRAVCWIILLHSWIYYYLTEIHAWVHNHYNVN
ncbi:MAG: hypothetical protein WAM88_12260, partial [Nitrososphaeraceae archaeon]